MFLFKHKNGRYYVVYTLDNGKRKTVSTGAHYKSEANKFLSSLQRKIESERNQLTKPIRIKEFGFHFLMQRQAYYTDKTIKVYKTSFKYLEKYFGNVLLSEINRNNLESYFFNRTKGSSIYATRRDMINLSSAFNFAVDNGYLLMNPCKGIKRFKLPERVPLFYTKDDFNKLINAISDQDIKDLVIFAVNTGMRQMESITLEWRQINFNEHFLTLDNQNHITKSKRIRNIPLNKTCIEILEKRYNSRINQNVFNINSLPIDQGWISRKFKTFVLDAGLNPRLNYHSIRHSFASWLVQKGVSLYEVSKLLGHSDMKVTQIYSHLTTDNLRNAVSLLN